MKILDLSCGIGWGQALHELGLTEHGIDLDPDVAATRALHGWETTTADIALLNPADFGPVDVLIASPPCQSFSTAGKRAGLADDRGQLVWQVERWASVLRPRVVVCEQVPAVLPIWRLIGHRLAEHGYAWWAGNLSAEQWGVPQTRKRAILVARRDGGSPLPPAPTHRAFRSGVDRGAGDPSLLPWVSMADALGFGMTSRPFLTLATAGGLRGGADEQVGGSGARRVLYGERDAGRWLIRPATTITGDDRLALPGHHHPAEGHSSQYGPDPIRLTVAQALTLQSFPPDFALAGTKTAAFRLIGNSVAPRFAKALLAHVLGIIPQ